ncbi:MAG: hypothetical protein M1817_002459 [Caeruleum heppii]|nr:MAG: hypothetical protein M1817_002459 [Caeruleum heppii]
MLLALEKPVTASQPFKDIVASPAKMPLFTSAQDLQRHPQGTRFVVYTLLDALMSSQRKALKGMGSDFVVGITDLVSAEKDPRNLMVIFSLLRVVMVEWDITGHVETLFDAAFCYFPITFRPPPDDPYGITAQDLKIRLRDCIASTSQFAGFAFPSMLDKLDSTSMNVKRDVLHAIEACALSYDPKTLSLHSSQLWDSIKYEILNAQEDELAGEALVALKALARGLSDGVSSTTPQTPLAKFLRPIASECNEQLQEPQQKKSKPVGQILGSIATASPIAFALVVKSILPPLLTVYQDAGGIGKQRALLEVLIRLLDAAVELYGSWTSVEPYPTQENPLEAFKDRLFDVFSQALMSSSKEEVSFRVVAAKGLLDLTRLRRLLADNEIGMIIQHLDEILLIEDAEYNNDLQTEAINALIELSRYKSHLIVEITFPSFMAKLPDSEVGEEQQYLRTLEVLGKISVEKSIFEMLLRRLLNKLDVVLRTQPSAKYPYAILSTILYALSRRDLAKDSNLRMYYDKLVVDLVRKTTHSIIGSGGSSTLKDVSALDAVGRLANTVIRNIGLEDQRAVAQEVDALFTGDTKLFLPPSWGADQPDRGQLMIISAYMLAGLRREIHLPELHVDFDKGGGRLEWLVQTALDEDDPYTRSALLHEISLFVNKWLHHTESRVLDNIIATLQTSRREDNSLRIHLWITKALVLRTDPYAERLLDVLLENLSSATNGQSTSQVFTILLAPDEFLSKENYAVIRLLHKQRLFDYVVPKLAEGFRSSPPSTKSNYLTALAGILRWVPSTVLMPHLDLLLPLLLQSIDLDDASVKAATIETMLVVIKQNAAAVEGHVSSVITRLCSVAVKRDRANPPYVRISALECLRVFPPAFRHELLLPYRKQVIKQLMAVLDDPKRHVRKAAVDCRTAWYRMDEPEED